MPREDSYYLPTTPPGVTRLHPLGSAHSRNASGSSTHSHDSSPESVMTSITTPSASSPTHQHGPQLLPKIRTQDVDLEPASNNVNANVGPRRHRRVLSNTRNPPGYMPYPSTRPPSLSRTVADPSDCGGSLLSPVSPAASTHNPTAVSSGLSSPIVMTSTTSVKRKSMPGGGHSRSVSTSSIDDATLSRYGYPTYRKLPKYVSQAEASPVSPVDAASFVFPAYGAVPQMRIPCPIQLPAQHTYHGPVPSSLKYGPPMPSPKYGAPMPSPKFDYLRVQSAQPSPASFLEPLITPTSGPPTRLLAHLTSATPTVNLVRTVNYGSTRGLQDYFWWDIRQLRSWSTFSLTTFNEIAGLTQLLKTPIHGSLPPMPQVASSRLTPESENSLISLIGDIYAPRVNLAMKLSQGPIHMEMSVSHEATSSGGRNANGPHFLGNYASDTQLTASGSRQARLVGIAKSFDRWNTGMRNERPHRRVEYLRGLAHLQRCMREHSCRYGFIITEVELVCVRVICDNTDDVPYFGYLEVSAPIPLKNAAPGITFAGDDDDKNDLRRSNTPHLSADDNLSYGSSSTGSSVSSNSSHRSASVPSSPSSSPRQHHHGDEETSAIRVSGGLEGVPMTASMALYFLLMLSKSMPLPTQPSGHVNVGGPGALTRQRILPEPRDKWIPEPQLSEKRDAKRVRGWIWPQDAWHRREGTRPKKGGESKTKRSRTSK